MEKNSSTTPYQSWSHSLTRLFKKNQSNNDQVSEQGLQARSNAQDEQQQQHRRRRSSLAKIKTVIGFKSRKSSSGQDSTADPTTTELQQQHEFGRELGAVTTYRDQNGVYVTTSNKRELKFEDGDNRKYTAHAWSKKKKWTLLVITALVQCSMNFNASVYPNAIASIRHDFHVSLPKARSAQAAFLIAYAFGCELWAPWSEELGRKPTLQTSLFLVNLFQIPAALTPNMGGMIASRLLGGLCSAGGSVTLGMVADMFQPHEQQYAVSFIVNSSVGGALLGPIFGGFIGYYLPWRWIFWIQLIFGVVTQTIHLVFVPETRMTVLLDREARRRRESGEDSNIYGPSEMHGTLRQRLTWSKLKEIWFRPFEMLMREPIVFTLSLLSGFSDALIFTFLESYGLVFKQWGFNQWQVGLCFVPLGIGYHLAYASFIPFFKQDSKKRREQGIESVSPERRLWWLLFMAPLLTIGIFGFAWTSLGPSHNVPWYAPLLFSILIGIANWSVYYATIDYMVAAYGEYSASATGGNGFCRDFLAGIAAMYSAPLYELFPTYSLSWASTLLGCISILVVLPVYFIYFKGPWLRKNSHFAEKQAEIIRIQTRVSEQEGQYGQGV